MSRLGVPGDEMQHYEERLERDLLEIRQGITDLGSLLEQAVGSSVTALLTKDRELAYQTVLGDQVVNRQVKRIDGLCHAFVARHLPSAGHLRFVSSVLRVNIALERVGDYAVSISREAARLSDRPAGLIRRDLDLLVQDARDSLREALVAFTQGNAELARGAMTVASRTGNTFDEVFDDLVQQAQQGKCPVADALSYLSVFNRLSRICDQAKNICEETVFAVTGEQKKPKIFKILFADCANDCWGPMAETLARSMFGDLAKIQSAGWEPAPALNQACIDFLAGRGFAPATGQTRSIPPMPEFLAGFDIIITLEGRSRDRISERPYHSVFLDWLVAPEEPTGLDEEAMGRAFEMLRARLSSLVETLTGRRCD